ncbi:MAG TPA: cobalamin-dependent protein, partial [Coriobacteriia bacterium]
MRVLLISSNTERINMVTLPLGLDLVAGATRRAGHEVAVVDALREPDPVLAIERSIASFHPEVIGVSIRNIDNQDREAPRFLLEQVRPLIAACRAASHAPIVLGGAGFSIFPDAVLRYLDADLGVRGDGETVFPELIRRIEAGEDPSSTPGVHVAGQTGATEPSFSEELSGMPQWDELLETVADPATPDLWVPVQSRRGCPN